VKKKVFIIDHELISPIAIGKENILKAIEDKSCGDGEITSFETTGLPFRNGAEIREDLSHLYKHESPELIDLCKLDRKMELLVSCFNKAENRLNSFIKKLDPKKTGVILGIGAENIPLKENETMMTQFIEKKQNAVCELIAHLNGDTKGLNNLANPYDIYSLYLAEKFNAKAFQKSILTACVSSTQALAQAYDAISRGKAEVVIAGGTDSIINLIALVSFGKLGVIAETSNDLSCKPFDKNRKGTIAGEAAGITILVSEEFMKRNNIEPLAEFLGYGNTLDAFKITAPDPSALSMSKAIQDALVKSNLTPTDIDYYYAHGTGTRQNDGTELKAFTNVFGEVANSIPISSTKDRHGHAIAAAGVQEFSILLELMKNNLIPANMNLENPINQELNLIKEDKKQRINYALTSNFAFGGINTVLAVKNEL
jgi:3-oxoacyl-[acyl-carrier-protein] synthase II